MTLVFSISMMAAFAQGSVDYKKLPGKWKFDQLIAHGQDFTEKFVDGRLGGNKFEMTLASDGSGSYDEKYSNLKGFTKLEWEVIPMGDRDERFPKIDFSIKNYNKDGGWGKEKYEVEKLDENILILNNDGLGMKLIFKRQ